jgi:ribonuclease HI
MKLFKDINKNIIFNCSDEEAEIFQDNYENPQDLLCVNVWYCDGSGFNGLTSGFALGTNENDIRYIKAKEYKTNNEMEYSAVILASLFANKHDIIRTDSLLVVNQVMEKWKIKYPHLQKLCNILKQIVIEKNLILQWIPREYNIAGKFLEVKR